jgi:hypothetical protein
MANDVIPDLIPNEFGASETTPPIRFLRAQQEILSRKTNGLVEAYVSTHPMNNLFIHSFYLAVPSLDNYRYSVFMVRHPVHFYPLDVCNSLTSTEVTCANEQEYVKALSDLFNSDAFKKVVVALMSQAQEVTQ